VAHPRNLTRNCGQRLPADLDRRIVNGPYGIAALDLTFVWLLRGRMMQIDAAHDLERLKGDRTARVSASVGLDVGRRGTLTNRMDRPLRKGMTRCRNRGMYLYGGSCANGGGITLQLILLLRGLRPDCPRRRLGAGLPSNGQRALLYGSMQLQRKKSAHGPNKLFARGLIMSEQLNEPERV